MRINTDVIKGKKESREKYEIAIWLLNCHMQHNSRYLLISSFPFSPFPIFPSYTCSSLAEPCHVLTRHRLLNNHKIEPRIAAFRST